MRVTMTARAIAGKDSMEVEYYSKIRNSA